MSFHDLTIYTAAAKEAALKAGKFLLAGLESADNRIEFKAENNLVTEMDRRSEALIKNYLGEKFPQISFLAEEGGESGPASSLKWLVDPIDGTTSYAHGLPHFSVSIALEIEGRAVAGVVYNPCLDECFSAAEGCGAYLNDRRIRVSETKELKMSLVATGFPYDRASSPENNINHFCAVMPKVQGIRRMGSAALDLCYTAAGRFDGFWEIKLAPWDTAAGVVILKEAGGRISDLCGGPHSIYNGDIIGSNGHIHNQLIDILTGG